MKDKIITLVGLGMLGASLAEKLTKLKIFKEVCGFARSEGVRKIALQEKVVDAVFDDLEELLQKSDIVIFCTPIPVTINLISRYADIFKENAIISDIASTKENVVKKCQKSLEKRADLTFVGGHPMAGSEKSGIEFRKFEMYENSVVFLVTPENRKNEGEVIAQMWREVGANPVEILAKKHDEIVAYASQSLHLVASGVARAVLGTEDSSLCKLASAGGFRDLTRIASSNPQMWREIIETNPHGNILALEQIITELQKALGFMKDGDWQNVEIFFAEGKVLKDDYLKGK